MKQTPLYAQHLAAGARMAPFAGWDMPIQYTGILKEHAWTRTYASIFDICHMGEFELEGPGALEDLDQLVTQPLLSMELGQCRYGYLLNDSGGVIDDLTVYRRGPEQFFIVVNAGNRDRDAAWIQAHLGPETRFSDLSDGLAKLDVQGPQARRILQEAGGEVLPDLGYFRFAEVQWKEQACLISRTGYTGEFGYELYFPAEAAAWIWEDLLRHPELKPAGLGARDTLRLEVGYPLHGHELSEKRSPVGAARGMFIGKNKHFIGENAVRSELENGAPLYLAGLELEGKRAAREGDTVFAEGQPIGSVTSGSLAPSLGKAVALAYLPDAFTQAGTKVDIEIRAQAHPAQIVPLPFYRDGTAR